MNRAEAQTHKTTFWIHPSILGSGTKTSSCYKQNGLKKSETEHILGLSSYRWRLSVTFSKEDNFAKKFSFLHRMNWIFCSPVRFAPSLDIYSSLYTVYLYNVSMHIQFSYTLSYNRLFVKLLLTLVTETCERVRDIKRSVKTSMVGIVCWWISHFHFDDLWSAVPFLPLVCAV